MKLAGFGLYRYKLPLTAPLALKGAKLHHREGLLLKLTGGDGATGWGEASPLPGFSRESLDEAARELHELAASMTGREMAADWTDPDGALAREMDDLGSSPSARFGFEMALWNLHAASRGVSLAELLPPEPRAAVPVNGLLSGEPGEILEEARRMREAGYKAVKLKIGGRPVEQDIELVRKLNEELGENVSLRLDANRAWSLREAAAFAGADLRFEYVEEPLADPAHLSSFVRTHDVPVALDESLAGMPLETLENHRYARAVVLKPTLLGGLTRTLGLAERASSLGMTPVISSAYESGVGTAALIALAAGIGEEVPAGLDPYRRLAADVIHPRLDLPAPSIAVRVATTPREPDRSKLSPVQVG